MIYKYKPRCHSKGFEEFPDESILSHLHKHPSTLYCNDIDYIGVGNVRRGKIREQRLWGMVWYGVKQLHPYLI